MDTVLLGKFKVLSTYEGPEGLACVGVLDDVNKVLMWSCNDVHEVKEGEYRHGLSLNGVTTHKLKSRKEYYSILNNKD